VHLVLRDGPVLDPLRNDEQVAGAQRDAAVAQLDRELTLQHEEEIVRVVVLVPDELALNLRDHDVVAVELGHGARLPVLGERGELLGEVDRRRRCGARAWSRH
jgi:hypothetical protein